MDIVPDGLSGEQKSSKLTTLPSSLLPSRAAQPFTNLVDSSSGCSASSGAMFLGEELFGRGDARGRRTLMETLGQAVPISSFSLQEILVTALGV